MVYQLHYSDYPTATGGPDVPPPVVGPPGPPGPPGPAGPPGPPGTAGSGSPSNAAPLMDSAAVAGSSALFARGDHVHPSDTSRLPLTGGNITGNLAVSGTSKAADLIAAQTPGNPAVLFQNPTTVQAQIYWNSTTGALVFQNVFGTGGQMYVDSTGSLYTTVQAYKPGGGAWIASSDARIKDVTGDYTAGLEQVLRLRPVTYRYRGNDAAAGDIAPCGNLGTRVYWPGRPGRGTADAGDGHAWIGLCRW